MQQSKLAPLFILGASVLWGCIGIFVRIFNPMGLGSLEILEIRTLFGLLFITIYLAIFHREKFRII